MTSTVITDTDRYARAFRLAADLIDAEGYDRHAETRSLMGYSVIGALDAAADQVDLFSDSLYRAFCGHLVMRDLVAGCDDAGIARWETDRGGRGQHEVTAELRAAAASLGPQRRKLADDEVRLVRQARDLAETGGVTELTEWLNANGRPDATTDYAPLIGLGAARALLVQLTRLVDDLTA